MNVPFSTQARLFTQGRGEVTPYCRVDVGFHTCQAASSDTPGIEGEGCLITSGGGAHYLWAGMKAQAPHSLLLNCSDDGWGVGKVPHYGWSLGSPRPYRVGGGTMIFPWCLAGVRQ